ncbi:protein Ssh4p [Diutina catenulata]
MESWVWFLVSITVFACGLLLFAVYLVCCEDEDEYGQVMERAVPRDYLNDEESLKHLAEEFDFTGLSPEEQLSYLAGQEFTVDYPPRFDHNRGKSYTPELDRQIKEMGVHAWWFEPSIVPPKPEEDETPGEPSDEYTPLLSSEEPSTTNSVASPRPTPARGYTPGYAPGTQPPRKPEAPRNPHPTYAQYGATDVRDPDFIVRDKTEVAFRCGEPYRTATAVFNMAMPVRGRLYSDTVYFETKVFEYTPKPNSHFAIGLVTKPYPQFRLPGYNKFSIAYESTGNLKINKPFPTPLQQHRGDDSEFNARVLPPLEPADIVGFGYVQTSGTIFITRNGRKVLDVMKGIYLDLYPAIGCFSTEATFQVNIGQAGYVWIEANVRKYGFISTTDVRKLSGERGAAALPRYSVDDNVDKLLDKGEELPPKYPEGELDFFGRAQPEEGTLAEKEAASTCITHEPEEVMDFRERLYEQETENASNTPPVDFSPEESSSPSVPPPAPKKTKKKKKKNRK